MRTCSTAMLFAIFATLLAIHNTLFIASSIAQEPISAPQDSPDKPVILYGADIYIDPSMLDDIRIFFNLNNDQYAQVREEHGVYFAKLQQLLDKNLKEADEAGFAEVKRISEAARDIVIERLSRGIVDSSDTIDYEEYDHHWRLARNVLAKGKRACDTLLDELIVQMQSMLTDDQLAKFPAFRAHIWRKSYQRQIFAGSTKYADYSPEIVDVIDLTKDYLEEYAWPVLEGDPDRRFMIIADMQAPMAEYERSFYYSIRKRIMDRRKSVGPDASSRFYRESPRGDMLITQRRLLYRATDRATFSLSNILREYMGEEYAQQYLSQYHIRLCPALHGERMVDLLGQWMDELREDMPEDSFKAISQLIDMYRDRRKPLRNRAIKMGLKARQDNFSVQGDDREQREYKKVIDQLGQLVESTVKRILTILPADIRKRMDAKIYHEVSYEGRSYLMGPRLNGTSIIAPSNNKNGNR